MRLPPTWVRDLQKDRDTVMELTAHLSEPQKGRIYQAMSMAVPVKALPAEWAGDVTCPCCAETLNKATLMYCPNCGQRLSVEEWAEVYNDDF